jgi:hypothetical protein
VCPICWFVEKWIIEWKIKFMMWRSRGRMLVRWSLGDWIGETDSLESRQSHALIGGVSHSWLWAPLHATSYKRGARRGTQTNVSHRQTVPSTNPSTELIPEGVEARERTNCAVAITLFHRRRPTPTRRIHSDRWSRSCLRYLHPLKVNLSSP